MTRHIAFWREVANAAGVRCRSVLMTMESDDEVPDGRAVEQAIDRFCRAEHIDDWRALADGYDVRQEGAVMPCLLVPWLEDGAQGGYQAPHPSGAARFRGGRLRVIRRPGIQ